MRLTGFVSIHISVSFHDKISAQTGLKDFNNSKELRPLWIAEIVFLSIKPETAAPVPQQNSSNDTVTHNIKHNIKHTIAYCVVMQNSYQYFLSYLSMNYIIYLLY